MTRIELDRIRSDATSLHISVISWDQDTHRRFEKDCCCSYLHNMCLSTHNMPKKKSFTCVLKIIVQWKQWSSGRGKTPYLTTSHFLATDLNPIRVLRGLIKIGGERWFSYRPDSTPRGGVGGGWIGHFDVLFFQIMTLCAVELLCAVKMHDE